jgi:hypothetical protein
VIVIDPDANDSITGGAIMTDLLAPFSTIGVIFIRFSSDTEAPILTGATTEEVLAELSKLRDEIDVVKGTGVASGISGTRLLKKLLSVD